MGKSRYIEEILSQIPTSCEEWVEDVKRRFGIHHFFENKKCILFGAAQLGKKFYDIFNDIGVEVVAVTDNNENLWGQSYFNTTIIPPSSLTNYATIPIVLTSKNVFEIQQQIKKMQLSQEVVPHYVFTILFPDKFKNPFHGCIVDKVYSMKDKIVEAYMKLEDETSKQIFMKLLKFRFTLNVADLPKPCGEEYYPKHGWTLQDDEIYVDIGAFTGDTMQKFLHRTGGVFSHYFAFEPDELNFTELVRNIPADYLSRITPIKKVVGSQSGIVAFSGTGDLDSSVAEHGQIKVEMTSIDEFFFYKCVSKVKIDVEGYEPNVLLGAKELIKKQKPKMAVCIYHRPEHLWKLILQIAEYNPSYSFYLGHYEPEIYGTVLYCV